MAETTPEQRKAINEFEAIRSVLRVPFPEDMRDLATETNPNPTFPAERRWQSGCLHRFGIIGPQVTKTEKKT